LLQGAQIFKDLLELLTKTAKEKPLDAEALRLALEAQLAALQALEAAQVQAKVNIIIFIFIFIFIVHSDLFIFI